MTVTDAEIQMAHEFGFSTIRYDGQIHRGRRLGRIYNYTITHSDGSREVRCYESKEKALAVADVMEWLWEN